MKQNSVLAWVSSVIVVCGILVACGSNNAAPSNTDTTGSGGVTNPGTVDPCATPNDGCACPTDGTVVDCGKVQVKVGTTVTCELGHRACSGGKWQTCVGSSITTRELAPIPAAGLGFLAIPITTTSSPTCALNLCDPYCQSQDNHPTGVGDGGASDDSGFFLTTDGGIEPTPSTTVDAGVIAGEVQVVATGDTDCNPSPPNLHTGACNGDPFAKCQQDFRCDATSNACAWNGGEGYYDGTAGGPDLTLGTACTYGGGASFPVCNRGTTTIASGTALNIWYATTALNGCALPTGTPDCTGTTTSALAAGSCINLVCNAPTGSSKYAVIGGVTEDTTHCKNNGAVVSVGTGCGACQTCNTTVSGTVKDPGKNAGLMNITVFQPNATPAAITDFAGAPTCDSCTALVNPSSFITAANTDVHGAFSLTRAAPGPGLIVSQTGRWRRQAAVNLTACTNTIIPDDSTRMPKNRAEGDIPKMALVQGDRESLECWLTKVGVDSNEIWPRGGTAPSVTAGAVVKPAGVDVARIQLYTANLTSGLGQATGRPAAPIGSTLWTNPGAPLGTYSATILPCDSGVFSLSTTNTADMTTYVEAGGRMFMDHLTGSSEWLNGANATASWKATSTWQGNTTPTNPAAGYVIGGANPLGDRQRDLYDWLGYNAPATGSPSGMGYVNVINPRADSKAVNTTVATEWLIGRAQNIWSGTYATDSAATVAPNYNFGMSYSFEVKASGVLASAPATDTCGRVIYNGMHVSQTRARQQTGFSGTFATSIKFPTDCQTTALSSEELALEYQFFALTACPYTPPVVGSPPASPPPPNGGSGTYTATFTADCSASPGSEVEWGFFRWIADAEGGSSITFKARTADTVADLATATDVTVGTANTNTTTWTNDPNTVDQHFRNDLLPTVITSQSMLQVSMNFTSSGPTAPILYDWRAEYSCVPAE